MKQIIKLKQETIDLFNNGTIAEVNDVRYYYYPFWLKQTGNDSEFEVLSYFQLPPELIEQIKEMRNSPVRFQHVSPFPATEDESNTLEK